MFRIRIRIQIRGPGSASRSVPKCHGFATLLCTIILTVMCLWVTVLYLFEIILLVNNNKPKNSFKGSEIWCTNCKLQELSYALCIVYISEIYTFKPADRLIDLWLFGYSLRLIHQTHFFFKLFYSIKQGNNIYITIFKRPPTQFQKAVNFKTDPRRRALFYCYDTENSEKTTLHFYHFGPYEVCGYNHHIFQRITGNNFFAFNLPPFGVA